MSKASGSVNWLAVLAAVVIGRLVLQAADWYRARPGGEEGVAAIGAVPAALHETLRQALTSVVPDPWDHLAIAVSGLAVLAAWARWLRGIGP